MFTDRLNELISEVCETTTGEFARITEYDRSYITHLRNGDRIPKPGLSASRRLAAAIYTCAEQKDRVETLLERIGAKGVCDEAKIYSRINSWLYDGHDSAPSNTPPELLLSDKIKRQGTFGRKLAAVMELANISNFRLAKTLNVDVSVISKYRSGVRVPRVNHPLIHDIAAALTPRIYSIGGVTGLSRLMGVPMDELTNDKIASQRLEAWLRDYGTDDTSLIESFLENIDSFSPDTTLNLMPLEAVAGGAEKDEELFYCGTEGLRRAVIRFLAGSARRERATLLLYSDQSMDWMTGNAEFSAKWMSLMSAFVRSGGKIRIIHNVDRSLEELLAAITNWLPLYISGAIKSWYSLKRGGERFSHTMFIEPENACIFSCYVSGREENTRYYFTTDKDELSYYQGFFNDLMEDCKPFFAMEPGGMKPQLSPMRKDSEVHIVNNTLSFATMPKELINSILERSDLPGETRRAILSEHLTRSETLKKKLFEGVVHECVNIPDEAALFEGRVRIDTELATLYYAPEEYAEHIRCILKLCEDCPAYRFYPLSEAPFRNIKLVTGEHIALFECLSEHPISFELTHPLICRAFVSFAQRLEGQYDFNKTALRETLKKYI
jgi:transcriptional regulator with XRE-family HTH domain